MVQLQVVTYRPEETHGRVSALLLPRSRAGKWLYLIYNDSAGVKVYRVPESEKQFMVETAYEPTRWAKRLLRCRSKVKDISPSALRFLTQVAKKEIT